jgi:hypothetical protein
MMVNRIFPDDERPPYDDGPDKPISVVYKHADGPMTTPYHETIVLGDHVIMASVGGHTKLEAAAVEITIALIHAEAVPLADLLKDPGLQIGLGQAATKIALSVFDTTDMVQTRKPGGQRK